MSKVSYVNPGLLRRVTGQRILCGLVALLALSSACSAETPAETPAKLPQTPIAITSTPSSPPELPTTDQEATPMPAPTTESASATLTLITETTTLAPSQALTTKEIVDHPLQDARALTDGSRKYRLALWSPGTEWIAAIPQDGPGLDAINASSGEIRPLVTDTFVLEPVWLDAHTLLVHRTAADGDHLARVTLTEQGSRSEPLVTSALPIQAIGAGAGIVTFGTAQEQLSILHQSTAQAYSLPLGALITAPAPQAGDTPTIAFNPTVTNLEAISTALLRIAGDQVTITPLSNPGEGLWLPRWSSDGSRLALTSIEGRLVGSTHDGRERFDLGPGDLPAWSPDGARIAYAGTSAGREFLTRDIHLVDWRGQAARLRLTNANAEQFFTSPSWSPDGARIAFVEIDDGTVYVGSVPSR